MAGGANVLSQPMVSQTTRPAHGNRCGAKTRAGTPCRRYAMENGRCMMHGGKAATGRANGSYKHGLYVTKHIPEVERKIELAAQMPVDDLGQELALVRALLSDYLDKLDRVSKANIEPVNTLVESIRRVVDTIAKIRANTALTGRELALIIQGMSAVLQKYVPEDRLPDAIEDLRRAVKHS